METKKWFENKMLVYLLLVLFFPIGLFGLYKNKEIKKGWKIGLTIFIGLIVIGQINKQFETPKKAEKVIVKTINKDSIKELSFNDSIANSIKEIENQFNTWDGSHIKLEKYIKENLNDEDSYKHVSTNYINKGDYLIVTTIFSAKNSFGGIIKNKIVAKVSAKTGDVIEIM